MKDYQGILTSTMETYIPVFERLLKGYFNSQFDTLFELLTNVVRAKQWHSRDGGISEMAKKHFGQLQSSEVTFLLKLRKVCLFLQYYYVSVLYYTQAIWRLLAINDQKVYTFNDFKNALVNAEICLWIPGHQCPCCLFRVYPQQVFESRQKANVPLLPTDLEKSLRMIFLRKAGKTKKYIKALLKDREKCGLLAEVLAQFKNFCLDGARHLRCEYTELTSLILESHAAPKDQDEAHTILAELLSKLFNQLQNSLIEAMVIKGCLGDLHMMCIDPKNEYYLSLKPLAEQKHKKESFTSSHSQQVSSQEIRLNKYQPHIHTKQSRDTGQAVSITCVEQPNPFSNSSAKLIKVGNTRPEAELNLMAMDLDHRVNELRKQYKNISDTLELYKSSSEHLLKKVAGSIKHIRCSVHGETDCSMCLERVPDKTLKRFKSDLAQKEDAILHLKSSFDDCYLCVHHILHEKHIDRLDAIRQKQLKSDSLMQELEKIEERIHFSQEKLNSFVSCCEAIDSLYEETVPYCCTFHQRWERIMGASRKEVKHTRISKKDKDGQSMRQLIKQANQLEKEFKKILELMRSQTGMAKKILSKMPAIVAHQECSEQSTIETLEQKIHQYHQDMTAIGANTCERLHDYLHADLNSMHVEFESVINFAKEKLADIKDRYSLLLTSCSELKTIYEETQLSRQEERTLEPALPISCCDFHASLNLAKHHFTFFQPASVETSENVYLSEHAIVPFFSRYLPKDLIQELELEENDFDFTGVQEDDSIYQADHHWYSDDEIITLLKHYIGRHLEVVTLDPMLGTDWGEGHNTLRDNLEAYHVERIRSQARGELIKHKVIIPVNLGQGHWVLVYAIYPTDSHELSRIYYFDSRGNMLPRNLREVLLGEGVFSGCEIIEIGQRIQEDEYNCGPWIIEASRAIADNGAIPEQGYDITSARREHTGILNELSYSYQSSHSQDLCLDSVRMC